MKSSKNPFEAAPDVDERTLVCQIGDLLVAIVVAKTEEGKQLEIGSVYEVVGRFAYGWNLRLVQGLGASEVRVLNTKVFDFFKRP